MNRQKTSKIYSIFEAENMKKNYESAVIKKECRAVCSEIPSRYIYLIDDTSKAEGKTNMREAIIIDLSCDSVFCFGEEYKMPKMERRLLEYLLEHEGKGLTKEELFLAVWDYSIVAGRSSTLTVHINRLRDKLEHDPKKPQIIKTVWGVGYKLCGGYIKRIPRNSIEG